MFHDWEQYSPHIPWGTSNVVWQRVHPNVSRKDLWGYTDCLTSCFPCILKLLVPFELLIKRQDLWFLWAWLEDLILWIISPRHILCYCLLNIEKNTLVVRQKDWVTNKQENSCWSQNSPQPPQGWWIVETYLSKLKKTKYISVFGLSQTSLQVQRLKTVFKMWH